MLHIFRLYFIISIKDIIELRIMDTKPISSNKKSMLMQLLKKKR